MDHKNEDISKSVSSIDSGAIFLPRSGQELSRNVGAVSVYALWRNPSWRIGPGMHPKNDRNFRKSDVCELQIEFGRPCRGLSPGKGFDPNIRIRGMACRDVQAILYSTKLGQIVANMLGA